MEKKQKIRKILCIAFAFLMSITLFVTALLSVLHFTLLDRDYFADKVEKSGYINILHQKLVDELANEGYISGFDEEFFASIITTDSVKSPVLSAVDKIYGTGEYKSAPKEELARTLADAFVKDLEDRGVAVDDEQKKHIEGFADECAEYFSTSARLPFISIGESLVRNVKPLAKYALIFTGAFTLFFAVFLFCINPRKADAIRYVSYAFGSAALMTAAPATAMAVSGIIKKISVADEALYYLIQTTATDLVNTVLVAAAIMAVVWIALAVPFFVKRKA